MISIPLLLQGTKRPSPLVRLLASPATCVVLALSGIILLVSSFYFDGVVSLDKAFIMFMMGFVFLVIAMAQVYSLMCIIKRHGFKWNELAID